MKPKIVGTAGDDTLAGTVLNEHLIGRLGDDLLAGRGGDDVVEGGQGRDTLLGGTGDDRLQGQGVPGAHELDSLVGGLGDDILASQAGDTALGGGGDDKVGGAVGGGRYEGGAGHDLLYLWLGGDGDATYTGDLAFLKAQKHGDVQVDGSVIGGFEGGQAKLGGYGAVDVTLAAHVRGWEVLGSTGDDHLVGNAGADSLQGFFGHDTIAGLGGDDRLFASGRDGLLQGGHGDDTIRGGGSLEGGAGDDLLVSEGRGANLLEGGGGVDTLAANDVGRDTLDGGAGRDHYVFGFLAKSPPPQHAEVIRDPDFGVVDLSRLDADRTDPDDDAFSVVDALDGKAGELVIAYEARDGMTHVDGDVDGDSVVDLVILIEGDHTDLADYVL